MSFCGFRREENPHAARGRGVCDDKMASTCADATTVASQFRGPCVVTVAYFVVYYAFMVLQLNTRGEAVERARRSGRVIPAGKTFSTDVAEDSGARMGERVFLNTLEQMGAFLVSLWMCAAFVCPSMATTLSTIALAFRLLMPIFWSQGPAGAWNIRVEISTQPYYACIMGELGAVLVWALLDINVAESLSTLSLTGFVLAAYGIVFVAVFALGKMLHSLTRGAYESIW